MSDNPKPHIINFPLFCDPSGKLAVIEENIHIPFKVERVYWIYDVPGGETRGGHAFRDQEELIIALSGSFDVLLDDGLQKECISLNRSFHGLYIPKMVWRTLKNFSTNSLCLIVSSKPYNPANYIRDYQEYKNSFEK